MPATAKSNRLAADCLRTKRRRAEETEERAVRLQSYIPQGAAMRNSAAPACVVCPFLPLGNNIYLHISVHEAIRRAQNAPAPKNGGPQKSSLSRQILQTQWY